MTDESHELSPDPLQKAPGTPVYKAGTQSEDDPFEFVLSDESVDRAGDIIRAKGWDLEAFKSNPVALFGHDHSQIVGIWENVRVEGKKLLGRIRFAKEGTSEMIDTARKLVEQRIIRAVSVGFMPIEGQPMRSTGGFEYTKSVLHEGSLVAVPCNPNALAVAKAISPSAEQFLVRADSEEIDAIWKSPGRSADPVTTPNLEAAKTRAEKLGIL